MDYEEHERREARWEWVAGVLGVILWALLDLGTAMQSWLILGVALAIPLVFSLVRLLAADPRSD